MDKIFPKTSNYLRSKSSSSYDELDKIALNFLENEGVYERASQALRRRFVRGASFVEGYDRGGRLTKIKREGNKGKYKYYLEGVNGSWIEPEERIWIVAMYALWQKNK